MIDFFSTTEAFADPGPFDSVAKIGLALAVIGLLLAVVLPVIFVRLEDRRAGERASVENASAEELEEGNGSTLRRQWRMLMGAVAASVVGSLVLVGATGIVSLQQRNDEIQYYADRGKDVYGVTLGFGDLAALGIIDSRSHRQPPVESNVDGFLNPNPVELRRVGSGERLIVQAKKVNGTSFSLYLISEDGSATELQPQSPEETSSGVG